MNQNNETKGWEVLLPEKKKKLRLDKKDKIIIQTLTKNCRTTLTTLSKLTALSKNSILNRIKNYENAGLIDGYSTFINIHKLGLKMFTIGIKTKMILEQKENFIEHLKKIKFLNQIITLSSSRWDFLIRIYARNSNHLDLLVTKITPFENITDIDILPLEEWYYETVNYFDFDLKLNRFIKKEDTSFEKTFQKKKKEFSLNTKDFEILDILSNKARIPLVELEKKVSLSGDSVKYRIKKLIHKGIIECFFANLNPFLLGYTAYAINLQLFDRKNINSILSFLKSHPTSTGVMKNTASWNVMAVILFKEIGELKQFEKEFLAKFGQAIHNYEFIPILEQPYYQLFLKEFI